MFGPVQCNAGRPQGCSQMAWSRLADSTAQLNAAQEAFCAVDGYIFSETETETGTEAGTRIGTEAKTEAKTDTETESM